MLRNKVIYGIALALAVCAFVATNSGVALALAFCIALAPTAGMASCRICSRRTRFTFSVQPSCTVGQNLALEIQMERPLPLRGRTELTIECRNVLLGTTEHMKASLAPSVARHERFLLPLNTQLCGHVALSVTSARATDIMGFSGMSIPNAATATSYTVYPALTEITAQTERTSYTNLSGVEYDRQHKGQDRTEVFEVRDYHDGDSLKSVHWKLSARFDDLLVREPSRPAEHNIVLLRDIHSCNPNDKNQAKVLNASLAMAASVSLALMRQGIDHTVVESDGKKLHTAFINTRPDFEEALDDLMNIPLPAAGHTDIASLEAHRLANSSSVKLVLVTDDQDDALPTKMNEHADLSVIRISASGAAHIDEENGYPLVHIPADAVAGTKVLEF